MQINIIAVGTKQPDWIEFGVKEYLKRLPKEFNSRIIEIPTAKRSKTTHIERAIAEEGEHMLSVIPKDSFVIALDERGKQWTTASLANELAKWQLEQTAISFLIGGPDGLAQPCRERAHQQWSLSLLTLPHGLVRIVLVEQLYRAWSIIQQHPYHRP